MKVKVFVPMQLPDCGSVDARALINDEFLSIAQVASRLNLSKSFVYAEVERGAIPHVRLGRTIRIPAQALAAYILSRIGR